MVSCRPTPSSIRPRYRRSRCRTATASCSTIARTRAPCAACAAASSVSALASMARTVFEAFTATAKAAPANVFLSAPPATGRAYHPDGVEFTYGHTHHAVSSLREVYAGAGYGHGHRVALLLENRPEFFFHYLALNALGCSIVPVNPDYRHDEMLYQMEHSEADLAVVVASRVGDVEAVARERRAPLPVIDAEHLPRTLPKPQPPPRRGVPGLDTETSLLYTSGTTGRPKGCILTNFYYLNAGAWYRDLGAGVEPELHKKFEQRFGFPLLEVWGMTETGRIYADCHEPRQVTTRAFGRPFGGLAARVVNDADHDLARGAEGELLVRWGGPPGPRHRFFSGYLKNAEATEEAWRGGWFHTGDVVRRMPDDMLVFVDRKKNIIRRSGENIAAAEVEACLQGHESVAQVAVLAVPDDVREEEVMACIVPMAGVAADRALAERLQDWSLARLAYFKAPGWVLFVATLPTTGTQKVQKTQIFPKGEDPRRRPTALDLRERKKRT